MIRKGEGASVFMEYYPKIVPISYSLSSILIYKTPEDSNVLRLIVPAPI